MPAGAPAQDYVLGVDGGNTKTIALVARLDGTIAGAARGGCGDIYGVFSGLSPEAAAASALATIESTVEAALRQAGVTADALAAGGFSLAGADWPEDIVFLESALRERGFGRSIVVVNDAIGALRAGSADGTGVSVVCGTGPAIGARAGDGTLWHASHWLEAFGGSHVLGTAALRAVYRAELGVAAPTALTARVLDLFGLPSVEDVLHALTTRTEGLRHDAGRLAPLLLEAAQAGDAVARGIVEEHGDGLGRYALAAARRVGIEGRPFTLVLAGGVLRHPAPLLRETIVARVRTTSPNVRSVASSFEPAAGALFLALDAARATLDEPFLSRLKATLPPPALFATHRAAALSDR